MARTKIKNAKNFNSMNSADNKKERIKIMEVESAPTSLLQAIERVGLVSTKHEFSKELLAAIDPELNYLSKRLGVTPIQAFLLGVCVESSHNQLSVRDIARTLSISNSKAIGMVNDLTTLVHLGLLKANSGFSGENYSVPSSVIKLLARNEDYKAPQVTGLDSTHFLKLVNTLIAKTQRGRLDNTDLYDEIEWLLEMNLECKIVKAISDLHLFSFDSTFMLLCLCTAQGIKGCEKVHISYLTQFIDDHMDASDAKEGLRNGNNELMAHGLVEHHCDNGVANTNFVTLTKEGRNALLADVEQPVDVNEDDPFAMGQFNVIKANSIVAKELFYEKEVRELVDDLTSFFDHDNYTQIHQRMAERNFRSAFTCLFYGGPGTGKTETVNQLARITGRDIVLVDVPQIKDKWVGESEKNIKAVFDEYQRIAKRQERTPILLFNEADSLFGKRLTNVDHSADQMLNTMQNIILQEMENLDGILIATTNLTKNLDDAFDRRFLYKIKFERPGVEAREHIWMSMIPTLTQEQAAQLAIAYDFSGGQIENVARKYTIDSILHGDGDNLLDSLCKLCDNELIDDDSSHRRVGF